MEFYVVYREFGPDGRSWDLVQSTEDLAKELVALKRMSAEVSAVFVAGDSLPVENLSWSVQNARASAVCDVKKYIEDLVAFYKKR